MKKKNKQSQIETYTPLYYEFIFPKKNFRLDGRGKKKIEITTQKERFTPFWGNFPLFFSTAFFSFPPAAKT